MVNLCREGGKRPEFISRNFRHYPSRRAEVDETKLRKEKNSLRDTIDRIEDEREGRMKKLNKSIWALKTEIIDKRKESRLPGDFRLHPLRFGLTKCQNKNILDVRSKQILSATKPPVKYEDILGNPIILRHLEPDKRNNAISAANYIIAERNRERRRRDC